MRSSKSNPPPAGGPRLRALAVGAALRPVLRLFEWFTDVARHSGLPGILIVAGLLTWPMAVAVAWVTDDRTRDLAWSVAVVAGAAFLAGAIWRKMVLRSAQRRRRAIANAQALAELEQSKHDDWVDHVTRRRQTSPSGPIRVTDSSIMGWRRRRRERRASERRANERHLNDRRRGDRRRSATVVDADPTESR